jgi:hypothetical protein
MDFKCSKLYIDISKPSKKIIETDIHINYGSIEFYKKPITVSDKILTNISGNIIIYGSIVYTGKQEIENDLGFPLIVYRKHNDYSHKFINKTDTIISLHPHGLNCNTFVDGASIILEFGKNTINGECINPKFKVLNNSMFSLWHSHQHATSSSSVYSNLYIPYIIKDKYSDYIDKYFTINENDFIFVTNSILFDKEGYYNSDNLYNRKSNNNAIINFNGNLIGKYTPLKSKTDDNICDISDILNKQCNTFEVDTKLYKVCNNLLRLRLTSSENKYRRHHYGIINNDTCKFIDFYVISQGCGFVKPYLTKMVSLVNLDRVEILVDLKCNKNISLVLFDFDIGEIKAYYLKKNLKDIQNLSIYTGCHIDSIEDNFNKNIFDDLECKYKFLKLLNNSREGKLCNDLPYNICCNFKLQKCSKINNIDCVIKPIHHITTIDKEEYYYNWPNKKIKLCNNKIRNFYFNGQMEVFSQSWFNENDMPSLLFKFLNCNKYHNLEPNNILHITEICKKPKLKPIMCCGCNNNNCNGECSDCNPNDHWGNYFNNKNCCVCGHEIDHNHIDNIKHHEIIFDVTCLPLNISELKRLINYKFKEKCIDLEYDYRKTYSDINGYRKGYKEDFCNCKTKKDIKIVEICLKNNSSDNDGIK